MSDTDAVRFFDRTSPPHIITLITMSALSALSMNMFLPSLPNMTVYFDTEYRLMQLSVALYLGVNAVLQTVRRSDLRQDRAPPGCPDRGLACSPLASLGCVFAPNAGVFLFFRMCQAAVVVGMVLSPRHRARHPPTGPGRQHDRLRHCMGMAVAPMLSPALGGVLDASFGWQASFWALVILGVAVFWMCWFDQGETAQTHGTTFADQVRQYPELLNSPRFWGYSQWLVRPSSGAFFSYLGGAPFVGSDIFGLSPMVLGIYFGAPAVGYMVGNMLTGRYSQRGSASIA